MKIKAFLFFLLTITTFQIHAQEQASDILNNAIAIAKKENKNVFVKFSASWCSWCKKMDLQMKSDICAPLLDPQYTSVTLIVNESKKNKQLETPGALEILKKYKGERAGLPFWVIIDQNGKLLEDSFDPTGQNLGCPASKEEVRHFMQILKKTSSLTDAQLTTIAKVFTAK